MELTLLGITVKYVFVKCILFFDSNVPDLPAIWRDLWASLQTSNTIQSPWIILHWQQWELNWSLKLSPLLCQWEIQCIANWRGQEHMQDPGPAPHIRNVTQGNGSTALAKCLEYMSMLPTCLAAAQALGWPILNLNPRSLASQLWKFSQVPWPPYSQLPHLSNEPNSTYLNRSIRVTKEMRCGKHFCLHFLWLNYSSFFPLFFYPPSP